MIDRIWTAFFGGWRSAIWIAVLVGLLIYLPFALPADSYILHLFFTFFLFAVFGHAWNLMAGYCGLLSFGNQAYVGISGFALAILFYYGGMNVWLALPLAGLVSAAFAFLLAIPIRQGKSNRLTVKIVTGAIIFWFLYEVGIYLDPTLDIFGSTYVRRLILLLVIFLGILPLLRLQGAYFAVATWLIAAALSSVFNEWKLVGAGGGMQIKSDVTLVQLYFGGLVLLILATLTIWRLLQSRYGLALTAVRDDEEAAAHMGIEVGQVKMLVFVLSGLLTGLAAGLYYIDLVIITPPAAFSIFWSAYFVFVVVAGGMGTLAGPLLGAAVYVIIDRILAGYTDQGLLVLGGASILLMLVMPRGLMGLFRALRQPEAGGWTADWLHTSAQWLFGSAIRSRRDHLQPGVVIGYILPGSPLPYLQPDNPPWIPLVKAFEECRAAIARERIDTLVIYSTQWVAVLDQLWQAKPRISGIHVDENWHELGTLRYDLRVDTALTEACISACIAEGIQTKAVNYDGFPIDTGTIVVNGFVNKEADIPVVIAANNLYHNFDITRRLGEMVNQQALEQNKRICVIAIGGLSGTMFREHIEIAEDHIADAGDDQWNKRMLELMQQGRYAEVIEDVPAYADQARVDMGFKHYAWIAGALGTRLSKTRVRAYAPVYGCGAAIIEFRP